MSRLLLLTFVACAITISLAAQTFSTVPTKNTDKVLVKGLIEQADSAATITFKLYKDYITFEEVDYTTALKQGQFAISLPITEPTPGFLVYGDYTIPIFLEVGDQLQLTSHHSAFLDSLQYANTGALNNTYLKETYVTFDNKDAQMVQEGRTQNTAEAFQAFMSAHKAEKFSFLNEFLTKRDTFFSEDFEEYVEADINYWWGQNMMLYKDNHPASNLIPISLTLSDEYYQFTQELALNKESALKNTNYLKYLDNYTEWRSDRIAKGLLKVKGAPTRKKLVKRGRVETFGEVLMDNLEVRAKAHDENSVIGKLKKRSKILYLRDVTTDRFRYPYKGTNFIDHFLKVQMQDGQIGWVFKMGLKTYEEEVTEEVEVIISEDSDKLFKSLKYTEFRGKVLHYAISRDIHDDLSKGKRVRRMIMDEYLAQCPYTEYSQVIKKAYEERNKSSFAYGGRGGTSVQSEDGDLKKLADFTKNLFDILEESAEDQKNEKPKPISKSKLAKEILPTIAAPTVAESTKIKTVIAPTSVQTVKAANFSPFLQKTSISLKTNFSPQDKPSIVFNKNPLLEDRQERKLGTVTSGRSAITIPVDLATKCTWELKNNSDVISFYYQPGDKIKVEIIGSDIYNHTTFTGPGSIENTYLLKAAQRFKNTDLILERNVEDASPQAFKSWLSQVRQEKLDFLSNYTATHPLSASFLPYAEADINYWYAYNLMDYIYVHPMLNDKPYPMEVSKNFFDFMDFIPVNNDAALPNKYFIKYIQEFISYQNRQADNQQKSRPELADSYLTGETKDLFKAILLLLKIQTPSAQITTELNDYALSTSNQVYVEFLRKAYHDIKGLEVGMKAPAFQLLNEKGEIVQLADYKGKVIFLDFWATWCRPCIESMELHKMMHEQFKDKDVAFVYVSMENNTAVWKNYITTRGIKGNHLSAGEQMGVKSPISTDYKVKNIPYSLIIDPNGTVVWKRTGGFSVTIASREIESLLANKLDP